MTDEVIDREARARIASFEQSFGDLRVEFDDHRSEFREFVSGPFRDHEGRDQERQGEAMVEFGKIGTKLDGLSKQVANIEGRQWDETSKTHHLTPTSKRPTPLDSRTLLALVGVIVALGHALSMTVQHFVR